MIKRRIISLTMAVMLAFSAFNAGSVSSFAAEEDFSEVVEEDSDKPEEGEEESENSEAAKENSAAFEELPEDVDESEEAVSATGENAEGEDDVLADEPAIEEDTESLTETYDRGITLDANGGHFEDGSDIIEIYNVEDSYAVEEYKPVKEGKVFTGWYKEPECTTYLSDEHNVYWFGDKKVNKGTTVYAGWSDYQTVNIVYDADESTENGGGYLIYENGEVFSSKKYLVPIGERICDLHLPLNEKIYVRGSIRAHDNRFSFRGFYKDSDKAAAATTKGDYNDGSGWDIFHRTISNDFPGVSVINLYAGYRQDSISVEFHAGEGYSITRGEPLWENDGNYESCFVKVEKSENNNTFYITGVKERLKHNDPTMEIKGFYFDPQFTEEVNITDNCYYYIPSEKIVNGKTDIYVKWGRNDSVIKVNFDLKDGACALYGEDKPLNYENIICCATLVDDEYSDYNGKYEVQWDGYSRIPVYPRDRHYKFKGWFYDPACKNPVDNEELYWNYIDGSKAVNNEITLYAGWDKTGYQVVTFKTGDKAEYALDHSTYDFTLVDSKKIEASFEKGSGIYDTPLKYDVDKEGGFISLSGHMRFEGWTVGGKDFDCSAAQNKDVTITAKFRDVVELTLDFGEIPAALFWAEGPVYSDTDYHDAGEFFALGRDTVTAYSQPYYFDGWFLDAACTRPAPTPYKVNVDTTLYAHWAPYCGVIFDVNGGTVKGNSTWAFVNLYKGESIEDYNSRRPSEKFTEPIPEQREGYEFTGWYRNPDGTDRLYVADIVKMKQNGVLTVYGGWKQTVDITYDGNFESDYRLSVEYSYEHVYGNDMRTEQVGGHRYNAIIPVIKGDVIGIRHPDAKIVPSDATVFSTNLYFTGWYMDPECMTKADFNTLTATEGLTLYAGWRDEGYTVKFINQNLKDGYLEGHFNDDKEQVTTFIVPAGTALKTIPKVHAYTTYEEIDELPTAAWSTNPDGSGQEWHFYDDHYFYVDESGNIHLFNSAEFVPAKDMTFYAKYGEVVTVTTDFNGVSCQKLYNAFRHDPIISLGHQNEWKYDSTYKKMTIRLPKGAILRDMGFPYIPYTDGHGDGIMFNDEFQNATDKKYSGVKVGFKDKACTQEYGPYDRVEDNTVVYAKWYELAKTLSVKTTSTINVYFGEGRYSGHEEVYNRKYWIPGNADENTRTPINIPRNEKGQEFLGLYYYSDETNQIGIPLPDLSRPYERLYYISGKPYVGWPKECFNENKIVEVRLQAVYGENCSVTVAAGDGAHFVETTSSGTTKWTYEKKFTVAPGRYVVLSDVYKEIVDPENRIISGWYYKDDNGIEQRLPVVRDEYGVETYRVTENISIYPKWQDKGDAKVTAITLTDKDGNPITGTVDIDPGKYCELKAVVTGTDLNGIEADVHWLVSNPLPDNSDNTLPIKLEDEGNVLAVAKGQASVYAELLGVCSEPVKFNVSNKAPDTSLSVNVTGKNPDGQGVYRIFKDEAIRIKADIVPEWYDSTLGWTVSDKDVCSVSGFAGNVKVTGGKKEGSATITVSSSRIKGTTREIKIFNTVPVSFDNHELRAGVKLGEITTFVATVHDEYKDSLRYKVYDDKGNLIDDDATIDEAGDLFHVTVTDAEAGAVSLSLLRDDIDDYKTYVLKGIVTVEAKEYFDSMEITLVPTETLASPASDPEVNDGDLVEVMRGRRIRLVSPAAGAKIYYIIDGSDTAETSDVTIDGKKAALFTDAIQITKTTEVKAIAVKEGYKNSKAVTFTYTVDGEWGDAEPYKNDPKFNNDLSRVPLGIWYVIGDEVILTAGGDTAYEKTYTGSKITFNNDVKVFYGTSKLWENRDYTVSYANNLNAAAFDAVNPKNKKSIAPAVTVKGKGSYTKTATFRFTIIPEDINNAVITSERTIPIAVGPKVKIGSIKPVLTFNGKKLKQDKDYVVEFYAGPMPVGQPLDPATILSEPNKLYMAKITGKDGGNFTAYKTETLAIMAIDGKDKSIVWGSKLKFGNSKGKAITVPYVENKEYTPADIFGAEEGTDPLGFVYSKKPAESFVYGEDYDVYFIDGDNTSAGKHDFIIIGRTNKNIYGSKRGSYTITESVAWKNVKIAGLATSVEYTGREIRLTDLYNPADKTIAAQNKDAENEEDKWKEVTLYYITKDGKKTVYNKLKEGTDYTCTMLNTGSVGKFTLCFTGINGFSGSTKKTITVKAYNMNEAKKAAKRLQVTCGDASYRKGGAVPTNIRVTYTQPATGDLPAKEIVLREGVDYTLSFKNNKKVVENYNDIAKASARPTVVVKGRGNFTGSGTSTFFNIEKAYLADCVTITSSDVYYNKKGKAGYFMAKPSFTDKTGLLTVGKGKDIEAVTTRDIKYYYASDTTHPVLAGDKVPGNTQILIKAYITAGEKSPYYGQDVEVSGTFKVIEKKYDIKSAKVTNKNGKAITMQFSGGIPLMPIKEEDLKVTMKIDGVTKTLESGDYVIGPVTNNIIPGTAKVTIYGTGEYGGQKTFTIKITGRYLSF